MIERIKKYIKMGMGIVFLLTMLSSCYGPSPLFGTWADNSGSKIVFMMDKSYTAEIVDSAVKTKYTGQYTVVDNVLVFSRESGASMNTEWDIRAAMLYLTWVSQDGTELKLTMYRTAR